MKTKLLMKPFSTLFVLVTLLLSGMSVNAQHSIALADPLPAATIAEGETQLVTFKYTTTVAGGIYQIRFVRKDRNAPWAETDLAPQVTVQDLPAAPDGVVASTSFTVPMDALANFPLGPDQDYLYVASLFAAPWSGYTDNSQAVVITSALSTKSYNKNLNVLAQNPVGNQLVLNNNIDFKSANIFDISGRKVMEFKAVAGNNVDVSRLNKGMYILVSDNNVTTKFLKK